MQTDHIPPELFFPAATAEAVAKHQWVVPDFADEAGNIGMRVQAFVVEVGDRRLLVDPCVGDGKTLEMPFWHQQSWGWLDTFEAAGFAADGIDTVVHTHLHADHVGWDTRPDGDRGCRPSPPPGTSTPRRGSTGCATRAATTTPTCSATRCSRSSTLGSPTSWPRTRTSATACVSPRATATRPGHVSMWIESQGEVGLISGDFLHHPVQCAETEWAEVGDFDADAARETRRRMLDQAARTGALFIGTHFPTRPAGRVRARRRRLAVRARVRRPPLSPRLAGLGTTIFAEMSALAVATGAINLGQGFPDEDGPIEVADAAIAAIRAGREPVPAGAGHRGAARRHRRAPAALLGRSRSTRPPRCW